MRDRIRHLLASRSFVVVAAALAVLLLLPTLRVGFMMDDYGQRAAVLTNSRDFGSARGAWDLFRFQDESRAAMRRSLDLGHWPWWAAPDLRLAFFRPLSSYTHAFDYRFFPDNPALMRAESIAAYAAIVILAGLLYRRLLGPTVAAGLAALMYAIDDTHGFTVVWIANRNAVLAAAFGFGALLLHDRAARTGALRPRLLAPLVFAAGMLAGEAALATLAYLFAHALWLEEGPWTKRARSLVPYALVTAAWTVAYRVLGCGTRGSGVYLDPMREPLGFLRAIASRLPVLLQGQLSFPPSDTWMYIPDRAKPIALLGLLFVAFALVLGARRTRENAFFATGMLLALLPVCAAWPSDRLLIFSGLGAFGLIADFLTAPRDHLPRAPRLFVGLAAGLFVLRHLALPPFFLPARALQIGDMLHDPIARGATSLPPGLGGKTLVVVNGPDFLIPSYSVLLRHHEGEPMPEAVRQLAITLKGSLTLRRTGERAVEISLSEGFFDDMFSQIIRSNDHPLGLGESVHVAGMTATVSELVATLERPKRVEFTFDEPLSALSFVWVVWKGAAFEPFTLPAIGEQVELPAIDFAKALTGP